MFVCVHVDVNVDFSSMSESGMFTGVSLFMTPSFPLLTYTYLHILAYTYFHMHSRSAHHHMPKGKNLWQTRCISSLACLCLQLRTLCSVCTVAQ